VSPFPGVTCRHGNTTHQRDPGTANPEQKKSTPVSKLEEPNTESGFDVADGTAKKRVLHAANDGSLPEVEAADQLNDLAKDAEEAQVACSPRSSSQLAFLI
jgi:hypothetical protein